MTRRRVVFVDQNGVRCITEEFNGDKSEFEMFLPDSADGCDKDWAEIAELFKGCKTYTDFVKANVVAQAAYHSGFGSHVFPVRRMRWNEKMPTADEVLYVTHPDYREGVREDG